MKILLLAKRGEGKVIDVERCFVWCMLRTMRVKGGGGWTRRGKKGKCVRLSRFYPHRHPPSPRRRTRGTQ